MFRTHNADILSRTITYELTRRSHMLAAVNSSPMLKTMERWIRKLNTHMDRFAFRCESVEWMNLSSLSNQIMFWIGLHRLGPIVRQ